MMMRSSLRLISSKSLLWQNSEVTLGPSFCFFTLGPSFCFFVVFEAKTIYDSTTLRATHRRATMVCKWNKKGETNGLLGGLDIELGHFICYSDNVFCQFALALQKKSFSTFAYENATQKKKKTRTSIMSHMTVHSTMSYLERR
jgi:hypothetical protein